MAEAPRPIDFYGVQYANFARELYAAIRTAAMGEDIGQNGWLTADEQDMFIEWLGLDRDHQLLDIACGSGGPTLRIAERSGCRVTGLDIHADAIDQARRFARERGLADRADFRVADAAGPLPLGSESLDAITCIDAINHLPVRSAVVGEWRRVLRPGGRLLITDPTVVTGAITNEEIAVRASIGFFLFVPPGHDEALLGQSGFEVLRSVDRTRNMATVARRWHAERARREADFVRFEGEERFRGQQRFFDVAATLAEERRLSRLAIVAVRR